jgi:hypothetical protein
VDNQGQFGPQVTSIDSGNVPDGLFWTIPLPKHSVAVHLGAGKASLKATHVSLKDFGTIPNDLLHGPSVPATASFSVQWSGVIKRVKVRNVETGFAGEFVVTGARMEYTASVPAHDFVFASDPAAPLTVVFAEIGHERNGRFFRHGDDRARAKHVPPPSQAPPFESGRLPVPIRKR